MGSKHTIKALFVAANPLSTGRLDLSDEYRAVVRAIRESEYRDQLETVSIPAARANDLKQALQQHKPTIVHFCGHGRAHLGMLMRIDDSDDYRSLPPDSLAETFALLKKNVRLVVLNFCESFDSAQRIGDHVDFVIGTHGRIEDSAAKMFSAALYSSLGYGEDLDTAFKTAIRSIRDEEYGPDLFNAELLIRDDASSATVLIKGTSIPDFWNVPSKNEYFTGREDQLTRLDKLLRGSKSVALTQAITGLGGMGKTQIAIEFCHSNKALYPAGVFWADASSAGSLNAAYASFAVEMGWLPKEKPADEAAAAWLRRVAQIPGWLLVLDNADDPSDIDDLIPQSAAGHVLITTRHQAPGWGGEPLAVDVLPEDEAVGFLLRRGGRQENERALCGELAAELGYLPLALEQAAAYLRENPAIRVSDYLDGFRKRWIEFTETERSDRPLKGAYENTVATTWAISFEKLTAAAREALQAFAFLNPDGIPLQLFEQGEHLGPALAELDLSDSFVVSRKIVKPLAAYSFVKVDVEGKSVSVHRLVQEVLIHRLASENLAATVFQKVHVTLENMLPEKTSLPENWSAVEPFLIHAIRDQELWDRFQTSWGMSWDPTSLWIRLATFASESGRYQTAEMLERSAAWLRNDPDDLFLALNNRAVSLYDQARFDEALEVREKQLKLKVGRKRRLMCESALADTLRMVDPLSNTERVYDTLKEILNQQVTEFGEEDEDSLHTMNALAEASSSAERLTRHKKIYEIRSRLQGPDDRSKILSAALHNLACAQWDCGFQKKAISMVRDAWERRNRLLGEGHPKTVSSLYAFCYFSRESKGGKPHDFDVAVSKLLHLAPSIEDLRLKRTIEQQFGDAD